MSQTTNDKKTETVETDKAATPAELNDAFPRADAAFREECALAGMTIELAKDAWIERLGTDLKQRDTQLEQAKAAASKPGVDPLGTANTRGTGGDGYDEPVAEFNRRVDEKIKAGMNNMRAVRAVVEADPDLHQAMLGARKEACSRLVPA